MVRELTKKRSHERRNRSEPQFPPAKLTDCPAWLSDAAKAEWNRLAPDLITMGLLTKADVVAFVGYCQAYGFYAQAAEYLVQYGLTVETNDGNERTAPQVGIMLRLLDKIRQLASEFGCTPSSRGRMELEKVSPGLESGATEEDLIAEQTKVVEEIASLETKAGRASKPTLQ